MQMREATPSALVPGKRNGANTNAASTTSMITFSGRRPGGSSERSQPSRDPPRGLSLRRGVETSGAPPCFFSGISWRPGAIAASVPGDREQSARPPEQNERHQQNVRSQRQLRREEADIVARQSDQYGADKATADRAQPADDQDDEDEDDHAVAD